MKLNTKQRKKSIEGFENIYGKDVLLNQMYQIFSKGKLALDAFLLDLGRTMAETIMHIDREEIVGPDYSPISPDIQKWARPEGVSLYWRSEAKC